MRVFGSLFGKKPSARHNEDQVWKTAAACLQGLCDEAVKSAAAGHSVLVVCLTNAAFDAVDARLTMHRPGRCRDIFGRDMLRAALARPGTITIALSGSLPADPVTAPAPVEIIVVGRNASRTADDAISRFADHLGAQTTMTFHHSLEDALLQPFMASILPLLEKLRMHENEALSSAFLTRAIRNCQSS